MAGPVVRVEFVGLAVRLEGLFELGDLLGGRRHVVPAEQAEQRAGQIPGPLDQGLRPVQRMALGRGPDHEAAVAVHGRVERQADRGQERLPATRAMTDHADLAVGVAQPAQVGRRARHLADDPLVRDGDRARRPRGRHRVVRGRAGGLAMVEVRHHRVVPAGRERPGELGGLAVITGQVMDDHHAADRSRLERPGRVGLDLVTAVPGDRNALGQHRVIHRRLPPRVVYSRHHDVTGPPTPDAGCERLPA